MKRALLYLCLFFCSLSIICCVDVVQHITRRSDGTEKNIVSFTFSKSMFEMIKAMQPDFSFDYDDFFGEFGAPLDSLKYEGFSVNMDKIDNEFSAGYLFDMNINYKNKDIREKIYTDADLALLPIAQYEDDMMLINLGFLKESEVSNDEEGAVFLASAKYRLLVSKKCMPSVSRIILRSEHGNMNISYTDLYDEYLVEIPITVLMENKSVMVLYR